MDKYLVIYDDSEEKGEIIKEIIGNKGFGDVVVKKKRLEIYYLEKIQQIFPNMRWRRIKSVYEFGELKRQIELENDPDIKILHCFSRYLITDEPQVMLAYQKLKYIKEDYRVNCGQERSLAAIMFHSMKTYLIYLENVCAGKSPLEAAISIESTFTSAGFADIGNIRNFIQCIAGNFDSRYFNSLKGNEYTLIKSSQNKLKIKSEYTYYHLLPEDMKFWYVMPFHYCETENSASYTMERLHITDLAVKWVHGSIDLEEFEELMDKYFYFFSCRHKRKVSEEVYQKNAKALYENKVLDRIEKLKKMKEYETIAKLMEAGCKEQTIDHLADEYFELKEKVEKMNHYPRVSVIGHGDPCFSNALYNKSTKTLKFIDPKGALTEEELWMDAYYDIAKLSHSVCGYYDFFNNGMFDIKINERFECELEIGFDGTQYIEIFRKKLEENGYDYLTVRLYEASLFLSMLPLHMDYPHKIFGFILNVSNILKEIEKYV